MVRWTEFKETSLKKKKGVETLFAKRKKIAKLRSKWHVACSQKNFHCFKCPLMHLFMYIPAVRKALLFYITKNQIASRFRCFKITYNLSLIHKKNNANKYVVLKSSWCLYVWNKRASQNMQLRFKINKCFKQRKEVLPNVVKASEWQCLLYMHYQTMNLDII